MLKNSLLNGVRVLSLEQVHVLPWGTAFLADFGAEVVRVESVEHMNDRRAGPFPDGEPGDEWWNEGGLSLPQFKLLDEPPRGEVWRYPV